jgi:hypothetical protein
MHPLASARARIASPLFHAALVASLVTAPIAAAQTAPPKAESTKRAEAIERFDRGVELYKEGNYPAALSEFRAAYDLSPSYRVLYNIGQVNFQLQDYVSALKALETYVSEGQGEIPPARRAEVEEMIGKLRNRISTLEIRVNVADANISVDDVPVGKAPLAAPTQVNAGRHRVTASREGYAPVTRSVDVPGAKSTTVELELVPLAAQVVTAPAAGEVSKGPQPGPRMTTLSWIGIGVTGALTAAAIGTGIAAVSAKNELDAAPPSDPAAEDARSRVQTFSVATDVLIIGAVVTLGTTLTLTFLRPSSEPAAAQSSGPRLKGVGVGPGSVGAAWTF